MKSRLSLQAALAVGIVVLVLAGAIFSWNKHRESGESAKKQALPIHEIHRAVVSDFHTEFDRPIAPFTRPPRMHGPSGEYSNSLVLIVNGLTDSHEKPLIDFVSRKLQQHSLPTAFIQYNQITPVQNGTAVEYVFTRIQLSADGRIERSLTTERVPEDSMTAQNWSYYHNLGHYYGEQVGGGKGGQRR